MGLVDGVYQLFFKRSTLYVPFVLVGAYFANEGLDAGVGAVWDSHNKGKLFKHMAIPAAEEGEIALRVLATARRLGVPTVAVFSEADRRAAFVTAADEAFCIGGPRAADSYLRGDAILAVAAATGADAVHPGYGFLSENASFAEACAAAGVKFVGPPASAIRAMGDKAQAKAIMAAAGVPVVPGYHGAAQDEARLEAEAAAVGFPLLVKAVAGGGGKGMRLAASQAELPGAIAAARREAAAAVGDDRLLLERYITRPRHVEVQVLADGRGGCVYLFDRDCSVQRRHQKIIEEAPAPGLPASFHAEVGEAAVRAAAAVGYESAGTVEFILDVESRSFFFMEMNTRLQVEHPVTEAVSGVDLVELQLRVAAGEALPLSQTELVSRGPRGHAFEARLYAENVRRGFLPGAGRVLRWRTPAGAGAFDHAAPLRVDSGVREGEAVGTYYDPMIAKIVVHGDDRGAALAALRSALAGTQVGGVPTNLAFLQDVAAHPAFAALDLDTGFIERHRDSLLAPRPAPDEVAALAGALWVAHEASAAAAAVPRGRAMGAWALGDSKRLWHRHALHLALREPEADGAERRLSLTVLSAADFDVQLAPGGEALRVRELALDGDAWSAEVAGRRVAGSVLLHAAGGEAALTVWLDGRGHEFRAPAPAPPAPAQARAARVEQGRGGRGRRRRAGTALVSPMPGRVVKLLVADGAVVSRGAPLMVVEAMKMEHTLAAPAAGRVAGAGALHVGAQVEDGQVLLSVLPDAADGDAAGGGATAAG
ncbi:hypothetical protein HT031_005481 [Scenedesmus sp. PABB004]|nr:hypothetical protein HT031_005481 [Scenedesmus sp. PABB004]